MGRIKGALAGSIAIAYFNGILWIRRSPVTLGYFLVSPFAFAFLVGVVGGIGNIRSAIIGGVVLITIQMGIGLGTDVTGWRLLYKFQDMLVSSPVSPFTYMLGLGFSQLLFQGPGLIIFLSLLSLVGRSLEQLPLVLAVVLATWIFASCMGFFYSTFLSNVRNAFPLGNVIGATLAVLPPVFYSPLLIPDSIRWIVYLIPTVDSSILLHGILDSPSAFLTVEFVTSSVILVLYTALFLVIAVRKSRWREP